MINLLLKVLRKESKIGENKGNPTRKEEDKDKIDKIDNKMVNKEEKESKSEM